MQEKTASETPLFEQMLARYKGKAVTDSRSHTGNWLAPVLVDAEQGTVTLEYAVRREMTNPYGNIHGGMMSALIDETIGWAVVSLELPQHYTSLNLNIDFLYSIREGETLRATGRIVRAGKKIIHAECLVENAEGQLLAKATSNLVVTSMKIQEPGQEQ